MFVNSCDLVPIEAVRDDITLVPDFPGAYAWFFRTPLSGLSVENCVVREGAALLYVGIAPRFRRTGADRTTRTLRARVKNHVFGNVRTSTLRRSLAALLIDELSLTAYKRGNRISLADDESRITEWCRNNAMLAWTFCEKPWELEHELLSALTLPLNLAGNARSPQRRFLSGRRNALFANALADSAVPPSNDDEIVADFTRIASSTTGTEIEVLHITWTGSHTPSSNWCVAARLPAGSAPDAIARARHQLLSVREHFRVCKRCNQRTPVGWMCDGRICQGCAERYEGVVF
jgi:hypothetical protein